MKKTMKIGVVIVIAFALSLTTNALAAPPMSLIDQIKIELELVQNIILDAITDLSTQLSVTEQKIDDLDPKLDDVISNQQDTNSDLTTVKNQVNSIQNEVGYILKMEQIQGNFVKSSSGGSTLFSEDYNGKVRHVSLTIKSERIGNGVLPFFDAGDYLTIKIVFPNSEGVASSMPIFKITSTNWRYEPFHLEFDTVAWSIQLVHGSGSYDIATRFYGTVTYSE